MLVGVGKRTQSGTSSGSSFNSIAKTGRLLEKRPGWRNPHLNYTQTGCCLSASPAMNTNAWGGAVLAIIQTGVQLKCLELSRICDQSQKHAAP